MSQARPGVQAGALTEDLARLPLVDHHCHSLQDDWASLSDGPAWRRCFTTSHSPAVLADGVPNLLGFHRFLMTLAAQLDLPHTGPADSKLEARLRARRDELTGADAVGYLRRLLDGAGISTLLVDTGFGGAEVLSLAALREVAGRPVREVVRVESVAEAIIRSGGRSTLSPEGFGEALEAGLRRELAGGAVALKSVLAYRVGLALRRPGPAEVRHALREADPRAQGTRLDDPVLTAFAVWRAAELAAELEVPVQFHTGFGDADLHLPETDPTLLRELLGDPRTEGCHIVLLHCYPFVRQAAYLAALYPQVWMDLSLAIPLAEPAASRLVAEALALCPVTKLLAASDGYSYPEMHWWAAIIWRRALAEALEPEVNAGRLDRAAAVEFAGLVLAGNATRLYRL